MAGRAQRFLQELFSALRTPVSEDPPVAEATCPECGRSVVVAPDRVRGGGLGPMMVPRMHQELLAACPVHGRRQGSRRRRRR